MFSWSIVGDQSRRKSFPTDKEYYTPMTMKQVENRRWMTIYENQGLNSLPISHSRGPSIGACVCDQWFGVYKIYRYSLHILEKLIIVPITKILILQKKMISKNPSSSNILLTSTPSPGSSKKTLGSGDEVVLTCLGKQESAQAAQTLFYIFLSS